MFISLLFIVFCHWSTIDGKQVDFYFGKDHIVMSTVFLCRVFLRGKLIKTFQSQSETYRLSVKIATPIFNIRHVKKLQYIILGYIVYSSTW